MFFLWLQIVEKLLIAAVADADVSVRHSVFQSLHGNKGFDDFLAHADNLRAIVIALKDEVWLLFFIWSWKHRSWRVLGLDYFDHHGYLIWVWEWFCGCLRSVMSKAMAIGRDQAEPSSSWPISNSSSSHIFKFQAWLEFEQGAWQPQLEIGLMPPFPSSSSITKELGQLKFKLALYCVYYIIKPMMLYVHLSFVGPTWNIILHI